MQKTKWIVFKCHSELELHENHSKLGLHENHSELGFHEKQSELLSGREKIRFKLKIFFYDLVYFPIKFPANFPEQTFISKHHTSYLCIT